MVRFIRYYGEGTLHKGEAEETFHRWVQVEVARRQGLAAFVADLGVMMEQEGHESQRGRLEELIVHRWKKPEQVWEESISVDN